MDLADVMDAIADQLATITGLRVHSSPPGAIQPPAAVVSYPERIDFDATYGRGMDAMKLPVVLAVGRPTDRPTRDAMSAYCSGSGANSVKAVLESGVYADFHTVRVTSVDFDVVSIGAVDYLAAVFALEISGTGS